MAAQGTLVAQASLTPKRPNKWASYFKRSWPLYAMLLPMIVYQLNGEPLSASVGGTNQLWLGSTSARYFASDVVEVRVTCEDEAPAIPGSPASGDHASNVPNVGVTAGASA